MYNVVTIDNERHRYGHFTNVALCPGLFTGSIDNVVDIYKFTSLLSIVPESWTCHVVLRPTTTDGIEAMLRCHGRYIKGFVLQTNPAMLYHMVDQPLTKAFKEICNRYKIHLSCLLSWDSPHIYVPRPRYLPKITGLFQHVLLHSDQPDAYHCIDYMVEYLLQSGANSRHLFPTFFYFAQYPLKTRNLGGYYIAENSLATPDAQPKVAYQTMPPSQKRRFPSP